VLAAGSLAAQQRPPPRPPRDRAQLERQVRARFDEVVRMQLGLDGMAVERLQAVVRAFQDERQALLRREIELRRRVRSEAGWLAPGRGGALLPDSDAREVLAEMAELRRLETELHSREMESLREVLTPGQLVRYYLLREAMAERLGRLRGVRSPPPPP
jgi:Spy/CpxP family protein refolding chaperone